jgi:hypothetical protein
MSARFNGSETVIHTAETRYTPEGKMEAPIKRLFKHVTVGTWDECWPFNGAKTKDGFGRIRGGKRNTPDLRSNRLVYEYFTQAPVPDDKLVELKCGNNACCNFRHMRLAPRNQNVFATKISRGDAMVILYSPDPIPTLAARYGVTSEAIRAIKRGKTHGYLKR